jgi:metal-responsive CopG/Arc/MetJ family transcriptional regulator
MVYIMSEEINKEKVMISIRRDYLREIDALIGRGAASNRSELIEKVIGSFLQDLRQKRANSDTALGAFVGFLILLIGAAAIAELLGGGQS